MIKKINFFNYKKKKKKKNKKKFINFIKNNKILKKFLILIKYIILFI